MQDSEFRFLGYRVHEVSYRLDKKPLAEKVNIRIDAHHHFRSEDSRFVEVELECEVKTEDEGFVLSVTMCGGFKASDAMSDELFKNVSHVSAPAVLYPFLRAFVSTLTAQAGIQAITLPLVNLTHEKPRNEPE